MQLLSLNLQVQAVAEVSNIQSGQLRMMERFDNVGNAKDKPARTGHPFEPKWIVPLGRNSNFVGREEVLDYLKGSLAKNDESMPVAVLHGLGGVGYVFLLHQLSFALRRLIFPVKPN